MPVASYRSTFGIAKDSTNTTLSASVAAGATSIPVVGTGIPASSTITFVDGLLTESRAVTAGGGTSTLTVAALTNAHSANCYITSQLTASIGPADYIPVTVIEPEDIVTPLPDKGYRGSAVEDYDNIQGMRWATFTVGGDIIPDTFPYFVGGVTGGVDFTSGTPNQFSFSTLNTGTTQPTPFTIWDFNAIDTRIYAGTKVEEVQVKWDANMLLSYTAKMQGYISGPVSNLTSSYSAVAPAAAWKVQASIGGTAVPIVLTADVTMKRPVAAVLTHNGLQDPYKFWAGRQTAEGKLTVVFEDNTQLNNFLNNSKPALDLLWTDSGANPNTVQFHATKCAFVTGKPKQTGTRGDYLELDISFKCQSNTTDATTAGGGYAPFKFTVKNSKATGTYQ